MFQYYEEYFKNYEQNETVRIKLRFWQGTELLN